MKYKAFLCLPLLGALLMPHALGAAMPDCEGLMEGGRAELVTQPPQTRAEAADEDLRDWARSVESPVAWLTVEDQVLTVRDADGKEAYRAVYPALRLAHDDTSPLAKALLAWNEKISQGAWNSHVRTYSEEAMGHGESLLHAYTDITPIKVWGRVDDRMISFFMKGSYYAGGPHPFPHVDGYTFDRRTGRQIPLDAIVTNRTLLIAAIEAAFQRQYPAAVETDFPRGVTEALLFQHPAEKGLSTFCWYIAADGSLVIYYPNSMLASYAAGAFTLTIRKSDAPSLFRPE